MITSAGYEDPEEFEAFLHAEEECISKDKWLEGEKIHYDPGQTYILEWITQNSQEFRDKWNESCCRNCCESYDCGHYLRKNCTNFNKREHK